MTIPEQRLQLKLTALNDIRKLFKSNVTCYEWKSREADIEYMIKELEKKLKLLQ
jgi:hypothetical protein